MSLLIKKIGGKSYAYQAFRIGTKVVHKYIGPTDDKETSSKLAAIASEKTVPQRLHRLFWDTNPLKLDTRKNARYIIERLLELGDLDAVAWLEWTYPVRMIMETLETSRKISERSKNFWRVWYGN